MPHAVIQRLTARYTRLSSFRYYDLLVHVFVVVLLISNLVGQKICAITLFRFHGRALTANISGAQLLFPITYIFGEIFTEVFGYGASRRAIWLGFFSSALLIFMGLFVVWIPAAPNWPNQPASKQFSIPSRVSSSPVLLHFGWANSPTPTRWRK